MGLKYRPAIQRLFIKAFQNKCDYPPKIKTILSNIQELTIGKIFKYYKLNGIGFDKIKKGAKFLRKKIKSSVTDGENQDSEDDSNSSKQ